jgi:hypothetical protein
LVSADQKLLIQSMPRVLRLRRRSRVPPARAALLSILRGFRDPARAKTLLSRAISLIASGLLPFSQRA